MNRTPNAKVRALAGLALHHNRFSMVKLKRVKQATLIEDFALSDAPEGWLLDGKTSQMDEAVAIIQTLAKRIDAENCRVAIALPSSHIIQKRIKLAAYLNDAEREAHFTENLNEYFPGLNEALHFDYSYLKSHDEEDEYLLVAARREQVEAYITLLQQAGLNTHIVDVDIFALARAVSLVVMDEVFVILDLDPTVAQLILLEQNNVKSSHQIHMNADFIQQLKRGLQLFSAMIHTSKIEKIMLVGNQQQCITMREMLATELTIQTEIIRICDHVVLREPQKQSEFMHHEHELLTAIGLAIREDLQW